jgi:hypothetical protein
MKPKLDLNPQKSGPTHLYATKEDNGCESHTNFRNKNAQVCITKHVVTWIANAGKLSYNLCDWVHCINRRRLAAMRTSA